MQSLVEIRPVVLEKIFESFQYLLTNMSRFSLLGKGRGLLNPLYPKLLCDKFC